MWKNNEIDKWTHKTHEYKYKSDYLVNSFNTYAARIEYANTRIRS